jgi:tRNA pseudouridine13 synthase
MTDVIWVTIDAEWSPFRLLNRRPLNSLTSQDAFEKESVNTQSREMNLLARLVSCCTRVGIMSFRDCRGTRLRNQFMLNRSMALTGQNTCWIKQFNEDFLVQEINSILFDETGNFIFLLATKAGLTTWELVDQIAKKIGCESIEIGYSGLKDEGGVTTQFLSVPAKYEKELFDLEKTVINFDSVRSWKFLIIGRGLEQLRVGSLCGNAFIVKIRKVPVRILERLTIDQRIDHFFLNFYGPQRFAKPGEPPFGPNIGRAICSKDWSLAMHLIEQSNRGTGQTGHRVPQDENDLRSIIGSREFTFFQSSFESLLWNQKLLKVCETIIKNFPDRVERIGIRQIVGSVHQKANSIKYQRFYGRDPNGERSTVVQCQFSVISVKNHDSAQGEITLKFALPSGTYATTALMSFLSEFDSTISAEQYVSLLAGKVDL